MRILICSASLEKSHVKFDELVDKHKTHEIKQVRKSPSKYFAELQDGTRYQVVSASDSSRGYKADKAYIGFEVSSDIVRCVIEPCLFSSCLPEEERIEFF